jgi:hypothetical protein
MKLWHTRLQLKLKKQLVKHRELLMLLLKKLDK